jgi:trigger factor
VEKNITTFENCEQEIEIKLTKADLEPYYEKAYLEALPKLEMPGFRKGKVPLRTIKQLYGKQIQADAEPKIIAEIFFKTVDEDKIRLVGEPTLDRIENTEEGLTAHFRYEVLPDFELGDYKGLTVDEPVHNVTEEEIEDEILKICRGTGTFVEAEKVDDEQHVVGLKLRELDKETNVALLGGEAFETNVYLASETVLPDIKNSVMDRMVGDTFIFNPSNDDSSAPDKTYQVEIINIQKLIPKEFTNEFVETYTKGKFVSTEEFKEEIGFKLQESWNHRSHEAMEQQIIHKLIEMHHFPLPQTIVWSLMKDMVEDIKKQYGKSMDVSKLSIENMHEELRPVAERNIKWEILKGRIIEKEQLEVEDHDIADIVESEAARLKSDKGTIRKKLLENQNLVGNILSKKVMDLIIDFAITNEVEFEPEDEHEHHHHDHDEHSHGHIHHHDDEDDHGHIHHHHDDDDDEHEHHHH